MNYRNEWIATIGGKTDKSEEICVKFKNGREVIYTTAIFNLLKTDPEVEWIASEETGEILWCCD